MLIVAANNNLQVYTGPLIATIGGGFSVIEGEKNEGKGDRVEGCSDMDRREQRRQRGNE